METEQMRRILRQREIGKNALERVFAPPSEGIFFVDFRPARNWLAKMAQAREKIRQRWETLPGGTASGNDAYDETQPEEDGDEDDDDDDEDYLTDNSDFWRHLAVERTLQEKLFSQIRGAVQIRDRNYRFINSLPGLSYGIFRGVIRTHARALCPTKKKHDQWFEPMMESQRGFTRLPFSVIISTNGESLATLKGLRTKVPKKP